jgi:hypothetical protein
MQSMIPSMIAIQDRQSLAAFAETAMAVAGTA